MMQTIQILTSLPKTCNEVSKGNEHWPFCLTFCSHFFFLKFTSTYLKATSKHFCVRRFLAASQPRLYVASPWPRQGLILGEEHKIYLEGKVLQILHIFYG